jgi:two-component system phosphate regulon sensor histidine kinase PhoR
MALMQESMRTGWITAALGLTISAAFAGAAARRRAELRAARTASLRRRVADLKEQAQYAEIGMESIMSSLDIMLLVVDRTAKVISANRTFKEEFQIHEPVGQQALTVTFSSEFDELIHNSIESGRAASKEITFSHPMPRTGLVRVWHDKGEDNRLFVSIYDITDIQKLERMRSDFAANVSHELRTPMTTIRAMTESIQDDPGDEELRHRFLGKIIKEIDRLSELTSDLLTLAHAESEPIARESFDLKAVAQEEIELLSAKAEAKGLELTLTAPEEMMAFGDADQVGQVMVNLIDNAIACTEEGSVTVTLREEMGSAIIDVTDTGIGIGSQHQPRIFERFYRVDKGRSRARGGTGLGLAIVRHIAEAHGGSASVQSELNRGSTFTVTLPK